MSLGTLERAVTNGLQPHQISRNIYASLLSASRRKEACRLKQNIKYWMANLHWNKIWNWPHTLCSMNILLICKLLNAPVCKYTYSPTHMHAYLLLLASGLSIPHPLHPIEQLYWKSKLYPNEANWLVAKQNFQSGSSVEGLTRELRIKVNGTQSIYFWNSIKFWD